MAISETLKEFGVRISLSYDKKKIDELQSGIEKIGSNLRGMAFDVGLAAAGIFEFANAAGLHARHLQQTSDMLGINVEKLQEFQYAAKVAAGVSDDELNGAFETVSMTLDKFRHGNVEAGQSLLRLSQAGIGTQKMIELMTDKSVSADKVVMALSESFKNIKDPLAAVRLANEAGGAAFVKLLPLLKQGAAGWEKYGQEAHKAGVIDSQKTIAMAAKQEEQFVAMWETLKHLSYTIGYELMKSITPMVKEFATFISHIKSKDIKDFAKGLSDGFKVIFEGARRVAEAIILISDELGGAENTVKLLFGAFALFKGVTFFIEIVSAVSSLVTGLTALSAVIGTLTGLSAVFTSLSMIGGLADIAPALALAGGALAEAMLPIIGVAAAIGAIVVGVHDIWALANNKPTWIGQGIDALSGGDEQKTYPYLNKEAMPQIPENLQKAYGMNIMPSGGMGGGVSQENTFNSVLNVQVPPGTTTGQATSMVSNANVNAHDHMVRKMKADASRGRKQ